MSPMASRLRPVRWAVSSVMATTEAIDGCEVMPDRGGAAASIASTPAEMAAM